VGGARSINAIETDFGRNATVSSAGALGWMQFMPSSWERWGTDGDGDGRRDPRNPVDAISAHSYGHAVDISAINGIPIMGHQGAGSVTETTLGKLTGLQGYLRANQVISLMTIDGQPNALSMADHDDHIHVGFPRVPLVRGSERPADVAALVATFRAKRR
jgi:hypothetical protein